VDAAGAAAKPLPEWNPNYLVPPPAPEPGECRSIFLLSELMSLISRRGYRSTYTKDHS